MTAAHIAPTLSQTPSQGLPANDLTSSQGETLRGRVHGHVGGLLQDMLTFEVHPHGVGRIGQAAGRKSIRCQQIAELILKMRLGYRQKRQETCSNCERQRANQDHCELALSQQDVQVSPAVEEHGRYQWQLDGSAFGNPGLARFARRLAPALGHSNDPLPTLLSRVQDGIGDPSR